MYQLTHGLTLPGEQKDRNYNWPVDKNTFSFGKEEKIEQDGAKLSLRTDLLVSEYPITKIGDKRLEDFRQANSELLGRSKFRGTLSSQISDDFVFGVKSMKESNWNVGKCLSGDLEAKTQQMLIHDPDLGKSVAFRQKNTKYHPNEEANYKRLFGVPSVRNDLRPKECKSVSDITVRNKFNQLKIQNYGNEKDAFDLLYPNPHNTRGLDDCDFDQETSRDSLKELIKKNTHQIPEDEFLVICELAESNFGRLSYNTFINTIRALKREYIKYKNVQRDY